MIVYVINGHTNTLAKNPSPALLYKVEHSTTIRSWLTLYIHKYYIQNSSYIQMFDYIYISIN